MTSYNNSKIYKIYSHIGPKIYIGSTTKKYLCQRMSKHRNNYKSWKKNEYRYTTSFDLFDEYGVNNCMIELIETRSCKNKDELSKLEGHYIRSLDCVNKNIPGRTSKQYYIDNKDTIKQSMKLYKDEHKKIISIRKKIIYQTKRINKTNTAYESIVNEFNKLLNTNTTIDIIC